ncbi:MAG: stage V sporulation protein AC, partial [Oscillospiraceae bacterium]|nr:stage V sporulation protein AC [Oscillospiraceae bacterium]
KEQYLAYVDGKAKKSPIVKNVCWAFLVGGLICVLGQGLLNLYVLWGMDKTGAATLVSITLIFLSALFTGLDLYDKLAKHAGAGTLVPITGFANAIVSPALEFQSEGFVLGMSAKLFTIAGPVLVFGITASVIYGIILAIFGF